MAAKTLAARCPSPQAPIPSPPPPPRRPFDDTVAPQASRHPLQAPVNRPRGRAPSPPRRPPGNITSIIPASFPPNSAIVIPFLPNKRYINAIPIYEYECNVEVEFWGEIARDRTGSLGRCFWRPRQLLANGGNSILRYSPALSPPAGPKMCKQVETTVTQLHIILFTVVLVKSAIIVRIAARIPHSANRPTSALI